MFRQGVAKPGYAVGGGVIVGDAADKIKPVRGGIPLTPPFPGLIARSG